jgi:hypothetical protein
MVGLKAAAATEVHRAACSPLSMARILIRPYAFGEAVLSGTAGDGTVDLQAKPQFWPSPGGPVRAHAAHFVPAQLAVRARYEKPQRQRVGTRTNDEGIASCSCAALSGQPLSQSAHERRVKT